jgi:translation initiation factor 5
MVHRGGAIINISGATPIDDPEYRYKMPAVFGKIEGSGNGIKTAIPNITDLGLSLHRPPAEVNKFFGCELGAQTTYSAETDRAIVNGAHTDGVLQELVHRYVEKFVLCPNCNLPETEYKIKNEAIFHKCKACGAKEMVDMTHKLCKFILAENKKAKAGKAKKDKDVKKKKGKDDSDEDKKKKKKDKDKKGKTDKDKKKDKKLKSGEEKDDYIKDALMGGKKEDDGLGSDDDDAASLASEAGVDDAGALCTFSTAFVVLIA